MADTPVFRACTVREAGSDSKKSVWTELGAVWVTRNNNLRIELEATPVNGELLLMPIDGKTYQFPPQLDGKPLFNASTGRQVGTGDKKKTRWTKVGAGWTTRNGYTRVILEGIPVNGSIVLSPPKPDEDTTSEPPVDDFDDDPDV